MNEEEARAAAEAVERGEHPNQAKGDERLLSDIDQSGPVGTVRRFLRDLFRNQEADDTHD